MKIKLLLAESAHDTATAALTVCISLFIVPQTPAVTRPLATAEVCLLVLSMILLLASWVYPETNEGPHET